MQPQIPFSRSAQWSSSLDRATQLKSQLERKLSSRRRTQAQTQLAERKLSSRSCLTEQADKLWWISKIYRISSLLRYLMIAVIQLSNMFIISQSANFKFKTKYILKDKSADQSQEKQTQSVKLSFDSKKKAVAPAPSALGQNPNDDNISIQRI